MIFVMLKFVDASEVDLNDEGNQDNYVKDRFRYMVGLLFAWHIIFLLIAATFFQYSYNKTTFSLELEKAQQDVEEAAMVANVKRKQIEKLEKKYNMLVNIGGKKK